MSNNLTETVLFKERAARFRLARLRKGWSQAKLGRITNISQQTINRIERGNIHYSKFISNIAAALEVSENWLMYGEESKIETPVNQPTPPIKLVPIIGWARAGHWEEALEHPPKDARLIPIPAEIVSNGCFALEVKGNSMVNPKEGKTFLEGDIIVVDPFKKVESEDFVIVRQKNDGEGKEPIFKQFISDGIQQTLEALNPKFRTIEFDPEKFEFCGVVVAKYDYKL